MWIEEISKEVHLYEGKEVEIKGWLYNRRSSGKIHFLIVRDGTGIIQGVVVQDKVSSAVFDLCNSITQESSLIVKGKVRKDARSSGGYELDITDIRVIQSAAPYPISKKEHGIDFLLSHRHLWLRSRRQFAIMRIRGEIIAAIQDFFNARGFVRLDAPIFTPSACEGTTTLFEVPYFGDKVYLSQSGQLYAEAGCMAFGKVYTFGPTFRAELSKTRRHLTEFWQIEPEIAYAELTDIMKLAEEFVSYVVKRVIEHRKEELSIIERDIKLLDKINPPFPQISYQEAIDLLAKQDKVPQIEWGDDFGAPQETYLSEQFELPVMIHRYPAKCKSFYMKRDTQDPNLALCVDMIATEGYGEIIGGSQREENLTTLEQRIKEFNLPKEPHEWYLDLRRYGSVPHSGFGLGLERLVAWICKLQHIREAIPFPRTIERFYP
ncbi:MAG: asparagine--tRNA ligase [Candidatus Stahlbacteria bacterium]|nr:asparagine--tRNA ligase [Candidatus Stahlbacteria bacterium]